MLSRLKRKSKADAALASPAWHPNFRNYEQLPDIKVVRTAFFVTGLALLAALTLGIFLGFREWQLRILRRQITQVETQTARDQPASTQAVALYAKFQAAEAKVNEVDTFVQSRPLVSTFIVRLAQTLPDNIALDRIDVRETSLSLRLSVRGDPAAASGYATAYLEQLRADPGFAPFQDATFTSTPTRNPATGRMSVEFILRTKPVVVVVAKKS